MSGHGRPYAPTQNLFARGRSALAAHPRPTLSCTISLDCLNHRIQLTTDGHRVYADAVESAFGSEIDYAMLVKVYGADRVESEARYSPADYMSCRTIPMIGDPKAKDISTSFVERQNLTMRMQMRRFTRLTNAFSKKINNLGYAVALHFMHYNFCRVQQTLRVTPAMEAGIANHVWSIEENSWIIRETTTKCGVGQQIIPKARTVHV